MAKIRRRHADPSVSIKRSDGQTFKWPERILFSFQYNIGYILLPKELETRLYTVSTHGRSVLEMSRNPYSPGPTHAEPSIP